MYFFNSSKKTNCGRPIERCRLRHSSCGQGISSSILGESSTKLSLTRCNRWGRHWSFRALNRCPRQKTRCNPLMKRRHQTFTGTSIISLLLIAIALVSRLTRVKAQPYKSNSITGQERSARAHWQALCQSELRVVNQPSTLWPRFLLNLSLLQKILLSRPLSLSSPLQIQWVYH